MDTPTFLWAGLWVPQSDARYPCGHRRHKLHIIRFRADTKTHSFRCSSSPQKVLRLFGVPENFLPVCLNVVFLFLPRNLTAASFRSIYSRKRSWQNHIPSSQSFSCNRLSGNKKSRHTNTRCVSETGTGRTPIEDNAAKHQNIMV